MPSCPCCSDRLLRHIRSAQVYWFCRSCWQEMPVFNMGEPHSSSSSIGVQHAEVTETFGIDVDKQEKQRLIRRDEPTHLSFARISAAKALSQPSQVLA